MKKPLVTKDSSDQMIILGNVKTDVSERYSLATADGHCHAIDFVDNFSFFLGGFTTIRDKVLDKFKEFLQI